MKSNDDRNELAPSLENGELLKAAEEAGFEVLMTADQNISTSRI